MSSLSEFISSHEGFYKQTGVEQILTLAWFAHAHGEKTAFDAAYLRDRFREVGGDPPDLSVYLPRLIAKRPPQLLKGKDGYRLAGATKRELDKRYGSDPTVMAISQILAKLPDRVPDLAERAFLSETLNCYRIKAYRATITMAWNLAYDHLVHWLLADASRLASFNTGLTSRYPKKKGITISKRDDFEELKESEVIDACRTGGVLSKNTVSILKDKLTRRNIAAHPSGIVITQHQADDTISDLVENIILFLN